MLLTLSRSQARRAIEGTKPTAGGERNDREAGGFALLQYAPQSFYAAFAIVAAVALAFWAAQTLVAKSSPQR